MRTSSSRVMGSVLLLAALLVVGGCESPPPSPAAASATARTEPMPPPPAPQPSAAELDASAAPTIVGAAHILVAYKGALAAPKTITRTKEEAKKRAGEVKEKLLKGGATFEQLVKEYSDDEISKPTNGIIGNFERNVFPPAFSDAAFALPLGGLSEVVETPRGFHIIRRTK